MNHSPGPWVPDYNWKHDIGLAKGVKSERGTWIAKCHPLNGTKDDLVTCAANAKLIAAAPEMLAALETYVRLFDEMKASTDYDDKRGIIDSNINHHKNVRKLIALAKGES